jgi:hypothetical protein
MTPQELIDLVCPKIRDLGWTFYFTPETIAVGEGLGLDVFHFYALGRGGVLGDVEPQVVSSAFGYFNPATVTAIWNAARDICAPRKAGRIYMECSADLGRARFTGIEGLDAFCAAAGAVNDAADPVGLSLYAAISAEPLADDLPGRAMQLVTVLREFRGSAHLLAVRASGLDAKTAHFIRRPNDIGMFGWTESDAPVITDVELAKLAAADELTDRLVLPAYSVLDESGRRALVEGITAIEAKLTQPPG